VWRRDNHRTLDICYRNWCYFGGWPCNTLEREKTRRDATCNVHFTGARRPTNGSRIRPALSRYKRVQTKKREWRTPSAMRFTAAGVEMN